MEYGNPFREADRGITIILAALLALVVGLHDWSLKQERRRHGRECEDFDSLHWSGLFVMLVLCFLLATAKGRVENGIPIPSCRHFVVGCFACIFLARDYGQRKFTASNDTSGVEVLSLFQSGFNYG
jgi:hypothetical protein